MFTDEQKASGDWHYQSAEGNMTPVTRAPVGELPAAAGKKGLDGLRDKVAERRSRINLTVLEDLHGEQFLKAIDIVLDAVSQHITRFAALARQMAGEESREKPS